MSSDKIAVVVGSLRHGSFTRAVAEAMVRLAPGAYAYEFVDIGRLPLYNQDLDAAERTPPEWTTFRDTIRPVKGVLFASPEHNRSVPAALKNAIDVGSRPYGQSVWDRKPAAIVTASPGSIGGFGSNHQIRQSCVFLNMPVMQQPEAYLGHVTDDSFDESGCLKDGPLKDLVTKLAYAFHDWVEMIHRSRQLLAEDAAHAAQEQAKAKEHA